jgi:hypothetical protein
MSTLEVPPATSRTAAKAIELRSDQSGASATGTPDGRDNFSCEDLLKTDSPVSQLARNLEDLSTSR